MLLGRDRDRDRDRDEWLRLQLCTSSCWGYGAWVGRGKLVGIYKGVVDVYMYICMYVCMYVYTGKGRLSVWLTGRVVATFVGLWIFCRRYWSCTNVVLGAAGA